MNSPPFATVYKSYQSDVEVNIQKQPQYFWSVDHWLTNQRQSSSFTNGYGQWFKMYIVFLSKIFGRPLNWSGIFWASAILPSAKCQRTHVPLFNIIHLSVIECIYLTNSVIWFLKGTPNKNWWHRCSEKFTTPSMLLWFRFRIRVSSDLFGLKQSGWFSKNIKIPQIFWSFGICSPFSCPAFNPAKITLRNGCSSVNICHDPIKRINTQVKTKPTIESFESL